MSNKTTPAMLLEIAAIIGGESMMREIENLLRPSSKPSTGRMNNLVTSMPLNHTCMGRCHGPEARLADPRYTVKVGSVHYHYCASCGGKV